MESSSVLFEKAIPVRVKSACEDRQSALTIRIMMGLSKHQRSTKVLQVQITDELDPFFLYSLEANEDDFQSLKIEQCILVDFSTFPHKFIELLEYCIRSGSNDAPRFLAVLNVRTGDSTFSVVETNQFKHLSHLSLCFRQGNDSTIKTYLAARLAEYKNANWDMHEKLRRTLESLERSLADVIKLKSDLADAEEAQSYKISEMKSQHFLEMANEKDKAIQEYSAMKTKLEQENAKLEYRFQSQVAETDKEINLLRDTKHSLEIQVSELKIKLEGTTKDLEELQLECETIRAKRNSLNVEKNEVFKQLQQQTIKLTSLEQEVQDKSERIRSISKQLESETSRRASLEESLKEAQSAAWRAEEKATATAAEHDKCNQLIEKLQTELRATKAKMKSKAQLLSQQDALLATRQAIIDKGIVESNAMKREIVDLKADNETLKKKEEDLERKLQEAEDLLKSNQQMIQWLNEQLTNAQLGKFGIGGVSRCNFKSGMTYSSSFERPSPAGTGLPSPSFRSLTSQYADPSQSSSNGSLTSTLSTLNTSRSYGFSKSSACNSPRSSTSPLSSQRQVYKPSYAYHTTPQSNPSFMSDGFSALKSEDCNKQATAPAKRASLPKPQLSFADPKAFLATPTKSMVGTFGKSRMAEDVQMPSSSLSSSLTTATTNK